MNINEQIKYYQENFKVVNTFFLNGWEPGDWNSNWKKLEIQLSNTRKESFESNERIICVFDTNEYDTLTFKNFFKKFINLVYKIDISNFFVVVLTNDQSELLLEYFKKYSADSVEPTIRLYESISSQDIKTADTFCVLPWNHLMVTPYHEIKTCCIAEDTLGYANQNMLKDVWNNDLMVEIRQTLLNNSYHVNCNKCYEIEKNNKISHRQHHNLKFSKQAEQIKKDKNSILDNFELKYFDLRFTNLCNIRCRTCNHHLSSKWYQDTIKLDPSYNKPVVMKAGRTELDMWEQLVPHFDFVESVSFAGGEPLIMEEHYMMLDELERRGKFDVKISYNTNFLQTRFKEKTVFDYWKKFNSVTVAASLDDMGVRGEYIRKDIVWSTIENNRKLMMEICPEVNFKITTTVSILNMWHLTDFHRNWIESGYVQPQDINIGFVQSPYYYRIDIATNEYKQNVKEKILLHCEWLNQFPDTEEIQQNYMSIINFMFAHNNTQWLPEFWKKTIELDAIRNENILDVIPELRGLS